MGQPQRRAALTPAEYLRVERAAAYRSEYFAGEMFAMAGGSPRHSLIRTNLIGELSGGLKCCPCTAYDSDLRIRVSATGLYTYPDASVICGALEFDDEHRDTVLNPTLIAEVLSEGTEAYDRGKKFNHYRQLPSLREYLLVAQDRPTLERFARNADGTWTLTIKSGLDQSLDLSAIGVTLSLAEVYDKVDFTTEDAATVETPASVPKEIDLKRGGVQGE
jgi:Uma2 family endonuclease